MSKKFWVGSIAALGVLDWYCAYVKHEGTLSQAGREIFRTDTTAGKVVWVASWSGLTVWILPHIWNIPEKIAEVIS